MSDDDQIPLINGDQHHRDGGISGFSRREKRLAAALALSVLLLVIAVTSLLVVLGQDGTRDSSDESGDNGTPSPPPPAAPVPPAQLPTSMAWRLALIEHHDAVRKGAVDFAFGNYYFDWSQPSGLVTSRQENSIAYTDWRFALGSDVPWNVFYAVEGQVAAATLDMGNGRTQCRSLPFAYNASFWPQDFLFSQCAVVSGLAEPMPARFGYTPGSYDGLLGVARQCHMSGGGTMELRPIIYTDPSTGVVLRFDLKETSPGWNPQTWDILQQIDYSNISTGFLAMPSWCV